MEKRSKRSPRLVFFPLDPKKRHLHWATWSVFGSSKGGLSEDPKKRHQKLRKPGELRLCRSQASRAGMFLLERRGKDWECSYTCGIRRLRVPEVPAMPQVDSLACWMRHPNPFISLLSLMLLFRIRATSHEQPLDDTLELQKIAIDASHCSLRSPPISVT